MITDYSPLMLSLKIALLSTAIVFISGIILARLLVRKEFFGKSALEALFMLPLVLPPTVIGFGLLFLFGRSSWLGQLLQEWFDIQVVFTPVGAVIASTVVAFPLMYKSASAAFESIDDKLEHVARTMGASEWKIFWRISFRLAWPGLLAGLILSFARALGEFGATLMVAGYIPGRTDTIPLVIYFSVESGKMEVAAFWVIIIVAVGFGAMLWLNWWSKQTIQRYRQR
jgi:molybdate transport system permease protein